MVVDFAHVGDSALLVEHKHMRSVRGSVGFRNLLAGVDQVRKIEAAAHSTNFHLRQLVRRPLANADREEFDPFVSIIVDEADQTSFVGLHDRTMIAGENDDDQLGRFEIAQAVAFVIDAKQVAPHGSWFADVEHFIEFRRPQC